MKKLTFIFIFLLFASSTIAQVTLEKKYDYSASVVNLESEGYKYYLMDVPNEQCRIYNTDHSLFRTINCSVPMDCYLSDIKYISENVFNDDARIELVYTWYKYVPTQNSYYYEYDSKIINEDGSAIQTIDGARYLYIIQTEENTWKLFAYCYDYSVFPEKVWTNIYSLPNEPVSAVIQPGKQPEILLNAFPNPAGETVKVAYKLPENVRDATLHFFDNNGREIEQFAIDNHTDHLDLNVNNFSSGVYHYFVEYENTRTPSQKIVVR